MKLRIQGNSLRLRVTQEEIVQLRNRGLIESFTKFSPGGGLVFTLEGSPHTSSVAATFDGRTIRVSVPSQRMAEWIQNNQVGIEAVSDTGLDLLIEKDFQCVHKVDEQGPDACPHPVMS
jgi:hypothetical protein